MAQLNATLPPEAIVTNGAGNYSAWPNRFYQYRAYPSQLGPTSGSMGYGTPAAVASAQRAESTGASALAAAANSAIPALIMSAA